MKMRGLFHQRMFLFALLVTSGTLLSFQSSNTFSPGKVLRINLEQIAKATSSIKLSEVANGISYVRLETTKDCLFTPSQYIVRGDNIFARDRDNGRVFLFNRQGKFVRQIGTIGKGPGEHAGANYMQGSPGGDKVYLFSKKTNRLSCYSSEGEQLSEFPVKYASWWFAPLTKDQYIFLAPFGFPVADSSAFFYYLQDNKGMVTKKYKTDKNIPLGGVIEFGNFYVNPKISLTFQQMCDTVFEVSGTGELVSRYVLDFGKNRIPDDVWNDKDKYENVKYDYINWLALVETRKTLFVRFSYQKSTRVGLVSLKDGKSGGYKTANGLIENDVDGGPDFWPKETDGSDLVYGFIQPVDLLQQWQSGEMKNKNFRSQADHDNFIKMVSGLKVDDNPVVMIVKLK
jgi:hypothetical protein